MKKQIKKITIDGSSVKVGHWSLIPNRLSINPAVTNTTAALTKNMDKMMTKKYIHRGRIPKRLYPSIRLSPLAAAYRDPNSKNGNLNTFTAIIIPAKDIIPGAVRLSPAYIVFDNYEKILNWNRSLRFALAVCTLKEGFKNEI